MQETTIYNETSSTDAFDKKQQFRQITFLSALFSVLKRPWIPILSVAIITSIALYVFLNVDREYQSEAVIMVSIKDSGVLGFEALSGGGGSKSKPEHYYISILKSHNYKQDIGREFAANYPEVAKGDSIYNAAGRAISFVRDPRQPGLFTIRAVSTKQEYTRAFAETAIDVFQDRISTLDQQETQAVVEFLEDQLEVTNQKSLEAEEDLQNFLRTNNFHVSDVDAGVGKELFDIEQNLTEAEAKLEMINLNIESYENQIQGFLQNISDKTLTPNAERVGELRQELANIRRQLGEGNLSVSDSLNLHERRNEIVSNLVGMLSTSSTGTGSGLPGFTLQNLEGVLESSILERKKIENQVSYYQIQLDRFEREHPNISKDILEYTKLVRARDVLKKTLEILLEKREEARIRLVSQLGGLKVIDPPRDATPIARNTPLKLLLALGFALSAGIGIAILFDLITYTIEEERDVTENFGLPILGTIPHLDKDAKISLPKLGKNKRDTNPETMGKRRLTQFEEKSPTAEAYRAAKTSLLFIANDRKEKVFVVSSASPSEGKSLTTLNIAISAAQGGAKVLVIDCDMRRPTQHKYWGMERKPGLTNYLFDEVGLDEIIRPMEPDNLHIISAGSSPPNPAELLASRKMKAVIAELRERYDLVLIDTPPVILAVDSRLLASSTDGLIMVVKSEFTTVKSMGHAVSVLRNLNVRIHGVIINHAQKRYGNVYYFSYRYKNPYSYYYSYGYSYYKHYEDNEKE
ncbi:polysaccharide biosynthesis tyrosine autokinase [bacterium]|nr:polysaccharide biosynthesis tyrosine autokinase [bacterium]